MGGMVEAGGLLGGIMEVGGMLKEACECLGPPTRMAAACICKYQ